VNGTIHLPAADEPRVDTIEDSAGVEFLLIKPDGSLDGIYVELTENVRGDMRAIVAVWDEDELSAAYDRGEVEDSLASRFLAAMRFGPDHRSQIENRP
jgi:hypothetical protein